MAIVYHSARTWCSGGRGRSEQLLAFARREDAEHLAVLRDRAARDLDAVLLRGDLDDRLIAQRVLLVLAVDDLLDRLLHALGGDVLLRDAADRRVEEVLQLEEPLRRVDVLVRRHARDRG